MKLKDIGEFGLIDRLTSIINAKSPDIVVGIGDDTACVKVSDKNWLLTVDTQVENTHFIRSKVNPAYLGWKLSSTNVSDIVACGGKPRFALVSASLPKDLDVEFVEGVYAGIKQAQDYYGFITIGGNITSSNTIMLDMTLIGESDTFIPRTGAKPGQFVYLTGYTGLSRAGLEILLSYDKLPEKYSYLVEKHLRPVARIDKLDTILKYATSSIDISDGLVADLYHIARQSNVRILIDKNLIPIDVWLEKYCQENGKDVYEYILYGGEDYQVVFTSNHKIEEEDIHLIGYVEEGEGVYLKEEDKILKLPQRGYNHLV